METYRQLKLNNEKKFNKFIPKHIVEKKHNKISCVIKKEHCQCKKSTLYKTLVLTLDI